jgi:hypothetical protein
MQIKKIVICGDSFCSADARPHAVGSHFSEILNHTYGYETINLARGGITNTAICFQIDQAIKLSADLILFKDTESVRIDVPLKPFQPELGLKNFIYPFRSDLSTQSEHVGDLTSNIYSNTVFEITEQNRPADDLSPDFVVDEDVKTAVKYYVNFLQDRNLLSQMHDWMFGYWEFVLQSKGINYLKLNRSPIWEPIDNYIKNHGNWFPITYHTDRETQQLLASSLNDYINHL